jgi:hypothetical protein
MRETIEMKKSNALIGTHLATGYHWECDLTDAEAVLACDMTPETMNESWSEMCESVKNRGGCCAFGIEGNYEIDFIVIDGIRRVFH